MDTFAFWVNLGGDAVTIVAGGIAIYVFYFQKEKLVSLYNSLINISNRSSLFEVTSKLDKLSDYDSNDAEHKQEVINIFNEVIGQIQGNEILSIRCKVILKKIKTHLNKPEKFTEPLKRVLVSELRETLKKVDAQSIDGLVGGYNE